MKTALSINLNKVALLRNQRAQTYPDIIEAARSVIDHGAHGITVHPRPDERHIKRRDVFNLARFFAHEGLKERGIELNIEGNPFADFMELVEQTRPDQVTLVPDAPEAETSDTGWDVTAQFDHLHGIITQLRAWDIRVSLFMDPIADLMPRVAELGANRIELYTGPYAAAFDTGDYGDILERYVACAEKALILGIGINAGHDLTLENLPALKVAIPKLAEVSIGHAFIADSLWLGFPAVTKAYLAALEMGKTPKI